MIKRKLVTSLESEALRALKTRGAESPLLDARLRFMEVEGIARYVRSLQGVERVYPRMLPTQASGRWSTSDPPLVNFPPDCINPQCQFAGQEHAYLNGNCWSARDIVGPDEGWWWLHYDLDAIEGKIAAADAGDQDDLQAFNAGHDVHTIRTCRALGHPLPPLLTKALHESPECEDWRSSWDPPWSGSEDRRRHIFKTVGYASQYLISVKGVLQAKDVDKLGLTSQDLIRFTTLYLKSKPTLMARKRQVWDECAHTGVSYSWYGRRRRLYGDWNTRAKEGWSHRISATVSDYQNQCLIQITQRFPECHLAVNSHDGLTIAFPQSLEPATVVSVARQSVERAVTSPTGYTVPVTATWEIICPDLTKQRV